MAGKPFVAFNGDFDQKSVIILLAGNDFGVNSVADGGNLQPTSGGNCDIGLQQTAKLPYFQQDGAIVEGWCRSARLDSKRIQALKVFLHPRLMELASN